MKVDLKKELRSLYGPSAKEVSVVDVIMQPEEYVTEELFEELRGEVYEKKGLPAIPRMRFEAFREGLSAQIMHLGSFSEEGPTIQRIHGSIEKLGGKPRGKHHEIYLSDFRRTRPERLRTVIRQPYVLG